jgi:thioredoxin-like negative regulator of GroEL
MPAADIEGRTRSFDEASSRLASGDFTGAKSAATQALDGGGLSADQASEATLILIEAAIESGDIPLAQAALANAESTAMDLARVFVLQGRLAQKQGNESAAQTAFARARTEDPNIAIPQR